MTQKKQTFTRVPKLFIGPWIGEFGVELLRWQGLARTLAQEREWGEVIVAANPDRFFLYKDFATKLVPFSPPSIHALGFGCEGYVPSDIHSKYVDLSQGDVLFSPHVPLEKRRLIYALSACRSTYRNFGIDSTSPHKRYDILLHARATPKANQQYKNWPSLNFKGLVQSLPGNYRIASIGALDGAHKIAGTDDLRGIPLVELAGYCRQARIVIGPSSGAIHFAMHCGTPVLTWIGRDERCNYYPQWNPFRVPFCCLPGWQPATEVVLHKTHEVLNLAESCNNPIEYVVSGTKRSGHHGFIEWLTALNEKNRYSHWNDCVHRDIRSFPEEDFCLPSLDSMPKELHRHSRSKCLFHWNLEGRSQSRLLSYEGIEIEKFVKLPEMATAKHLIFILRDAANLASSLKKGIAPLRSKGFLNPDMRAIISTYRGYLFEAMGKTNYLGALRRKAVFVSYNRWHTDESYRRQIARQLGHRSVDPSRGTVACYTHGSGFQNKATNAQDLKTLDRWKQFMQNSDFWNIVSDQEMFEAELAFHGGLSPISQDIPVITKDILLG